VTDAVAASSCSSFSPSSSSSASADQANLECKQGADVLFPINYILNHVDNKCDQQESLIYFVYYSRSWIKGAA
jgi:Rps23 Pro-64 3,4-dihydroxylase Tpa1-like proline 4-hydroxylase